VVSLCHSNIFALKYCQIINDNVRRFLELIEPFLKATTTATTSFASNEQSMAGVHSR
jgi:hypothetical protein